MKVGAPRERLLGERRVALVPESVARLGKSGVEVVIQAGAGFAAGFTDEAYREKNATIVPTADELYAAADVVVKVHHPENDEIDKMKDGATIVSFLWPHLIPDTLERFNRKRISSLAMDKIPRITRAQSMDALSSMSSLAGYKCVIEAARTLPKLFPMMMTAAGTIAPAKVFVLGAGVAGLQAIATAKRLGANVEAYDVRPAVKEEVQSLGGKFVELPIETADAADRGGYAKAQSEDFIRKQRELMIKHIAKSDVVITTALIPGKKAPILVTAEMIKAMQPGSVVIDLAAEQGGNVEGSEAGVAKDFGGVTVVGMANIASSLAFHASQMYSRNITTLLELLIKEGKPVFDLEDEIIASTLVTHEGRKRLES